MVSALLGLLVSLSTFLCIGATSSVTYNGESAHPTASSPVHSNSEHFSTSQRGNNCSERPWLVRLRL